MEETLLTHSSEETIAFARRFSSLLKGGDVIALRGDLGTGKTCFAKGIISELTEIDVNDIPSPSFTLLEEYAAKPRLFHVDLYRLNKIQAAVDLPWDDLFTPNAITLIEWPERYELLLNYCQTEIIFSKQGGANDRKIQIVKKEKR
jgi:tRNA threonylcarbamoyladenosine biosynthesis protein TsaE